MSRFAARHLLTSLLITAGVVASIMLPIAAAPAATKVSVAPILNLETLTGMQAEKMMNDKTLTSVELTQAYIDRINALNKSGPGLNAVAQFNPDALKEAAASDQRRAAGKLLGPADGLPILMKDLIDVKGMYTSAGNYDLRNSYPATDAGITENLRAHGVVILGKLGLTEFANSFGSQPSGFSNLTGQVLNAVDADQNPSGSSSGTGSAMASALGMLGIGTETSGSIISPSQANGIVGLRPTVGLVPGDGIAPIDVSQDTAGPMARTVSDVALTLDSIAGAVPDDTEYADIFGPDYYATGVIPKPPSPLPDYTKALDLNFVKGKEIGYNGVLTPGSPLQIAYDALVAAGAIMVPRPVTTVGTLNALPTGYEAHRTIDEYYKRLGPKAPIQSLVAEVAANAIDAQQALKFGNNSHLSESTADITPGGTNEGLFRTNIIQRKAVYHKAIDDMMNYTNSDSTQPFDPVIGILGSTPSAPNAGYPQITIPMGYSATTRRTLNVSVNGGAYDEYNLIGIGYVIEQATHLRQQASSVDPSMYRCAETVPPEPFAGRGHCNPSYDAVMKMLGGKLTILPFSLETTSAQSLEAMLTAGTLTDEKLVRAYLSRIALTNAEGPAIQAVRDLNPDAISEAQAVDAARAKKTPLGPLAGMPVLLDDSIDVKGLPTSAGSIALENSMPAADSTIVTKLKAAGAIVLGKTNVTEMNGIFDTNMPEGYSSLGGQVLLPSDTDKTPAGSSGGAAAASASGLAALTIGMETSTDTGSQLIAPAGVAGVVGLKPTVGLVSRTGVLPVARSQDSPGPIGQTVYDVAMELNAIAGADPTDSATVGKPTPPDYTAGLSTTALSGKRIAVESGGADPYPAAVSVLQNRGATPVVVTIGSATTAPSIVPTEFKRDLNAYLGGRKTGPKSLQDIITYNLAHPVEGLKYQEGELLASQSVDLTDPTTALSYIGNLTTGKAQSQAVIDNILNNGTPNDTSDDFDSIMVPSGDPLVGIADRAGYPVLTIPIGFGATASGAGHNPIGVSFIGTAFSEAKLLADGYALEQATKVRLAPSYTNPSMWRCVPGSTFFTGELCNPGDRELALAAAKLGSLGTRMATTRLSPGVIDPLTERINTITGLLKLALSPKACVDMHGLITMIKEKQGTGGLTAAKANALLAATASAKAAIDCT